MKIKEQKPKIRMRNGFESNSGDGVGFNKIGGLAVTGDADDVEGRQ